jgi:hypothetical protein
MMRKLQNDSPDILCSIFGLVSRILLLQFVVWHRAAQGIVHLPKIIADLSIYGRSRGTLASLPETAGPD